MRQFLLITVCLLITTLNSFSGPGEVVWDSTYFDPDYHDVGREVIQTSDNGFIIVGICSTTSIQADVCLMKTDSLGHVIWKRKYGGGHREIGYSVQQAYDGGYIFVGYTQSFGAGIADMYIVKTNDTGDVVWTKTYGGSGFDLGRRIRKTNDSCYIVLGKTTPSGRTDTDLWLLKLDTSGDTIWTRTYGYDKSEWGFFVEQTSDSGYILSACSRSYKDILRYDHAYYLVKTDFVGNMQWDSYYGENRRHCEGYSVRQTPEGYYLLTGSSAESDLHWVDVDLIKVDSIGNVIWYHTYGGDVCHYVRSTHITSDGMYIVAGNTWSCGNLIRDFYTMKVDSEGEIAWSNAYGEDGDEKGCWIEPTADDGYVVTGHTKASEEDVSDIRLIKITGDQIEPDATIEMFPDDNPITVPAGSLFTYTGKVTNNTDSTLYLDIWIMVRPPGWAELYGPVIQYDNIQYGPRQQISAFNIVQNIPQNALTGTNTYLAFAGQYPNLIESSAKFQFTITGPRGGDANDWNLRGWFDSKPELLPQITGLLNNTPNPFNTTTSIHYKIAEPAKVTIEIYNILGRKVETLIDNTIPAGTHTVEWNTANYASGVYFYKLRTKDFIQTKRMMLVK